MTYEQPRRRAFERRAKRRDELMREPIDEADRIGDQKLPLIR